MRRSRRSRHEPKIWLKRLGWTVAAAWAFGVSGLFAPQFGPPGIRQYMSQQSLLNERRGDLARLDAELQALEKERGRLESDRKTQESEARRVLGVLEPDELVFDFTE